MCVDTDLTSDTEDADLEPSGSDENSAKSVTEILEREICQAQEKGIDAVMWLELEELDIDDAMLLSLDLSVKFPVGQSEFVRQLCTFCTISVLPNIFR